MHVLALDLGTGSVRACLVSADGRVVARGDAAIRATPAEGVVGGFEYDPERLAGAIATAASRALAGAPAGSRVAAVTAASMRPACAFLGAGGSALYLGANRDARGISEAVDLLRRHRDLLLRVTGQIPPVLQWSSRIAWFRAHHPETLEAASVMTGMEGWALALFGAPPAIDHSSASGTGLYDITAGGWSEEILDAVGLDERRLPQILDAGTPVAPAKGAFACALGLEGVPVCAGAADTHAALAGAGAWDAGETAVVGGTSMPLARVVADPRPRSARLWASRHVHPGFGVLESNCGESGFAWEWVAEMLGEDVSGLEALARRAAPVSAIAHVGTAPQDFADLPILRSGGLVFPLPPSMFGVDRASLARAAIEAAAWAAVWALEWVDAESTGVGPVRVCGGMVRSELFLECLAAALGRPVLATQEDGTSVGVAACAAAGVGLVDDARQVVKAANAMAREVRVDEALATAMRGGYPRWREAVARLERGSMRISALVGTGSAGGPGQSDGI